MKHVEAIRESKEDRDQGVRNCVEHDHIGEVAGATCNSGMSSKGCFLHSNAKGGTVCVLSAFCETSQEPTRNERAGTVKGEAHRLFG